MKIQRNFKKHIVIVTIIYLLSLFGISYADNNANSSIIVNSESTISYSSSNIIMNSSGISTSSTKGILGYNRDELEYVLKRYSKSFDGSRNYFDPIFSEYDENTINKIYLKKSKSILKMETITYYFTEKKENNVLFRSFKQFSKDIGLKNGAVYIPMTNDASNIFKTHNFRQDVIYSYSKYSWCDFSVISKESLLFEIRNSHIKSEDRCLVFPINDNILWLTSLLNKIHKNISTLKKIKNYNKLRKESLKAILENGIDYTINDKVVENNKITIKKFIQWLSNLFSNQSKA